MPRNNNPLNDCRSWCATCRARASTGHAGPYTAAELMAFVIETARPERDPAIVAAETERGHARALFDSLDLTWHASLAAKTRADIHGRGDATDRR